MEGPDWLKSPKTVEPNVSEDSSSDEEEVPPSEVPPAKINQSPNQNNSISQTLKNKKDKKEIRHTGKIHEEKENSSGKENLGISYGIRPWLRHGRTDSQLASSTDSRVVPSLRKRTSSTEEIQSIYQSQQVRHPGRNKNRWHEIDICNKTKTQ